MSYDCSVKHRHCTLTFVLEYFRYIELAIYRIENMFCSPSPGIPVFFMLTLKEV